MQRVAEGLQRGCRGVAEGCQGMQRDEMGAERRLSHGGGQAEELLHMRVATACENDFDAA